VTERINASRGALIAVALLVIASCRARVSEIAPLSIHTREDTVYLQRLADRVVLKTDVVITNRDKANVFMPICNPFAERRVERTWVVVFTTFCMVQSPRTIPANDSVVVPVVLSGFTDGNSLPRLDPRATSGEYRLIFNYWQSGNEQSSLASDDIRRITSPVFVVADRGSAK
jgi:hypothetical protein